MCANIKNYFQKTPMKEPQYMKKLSKQMMEVDLLLSQLCDAMNVFKLPVKSVTGQACEHRAIHLNGQINYWIKTAQALIKTKFDIISANVINF